MTQGNWEQGRYVLKVAKFEHHARAAATQNNMPAAGVTGLHCITQSVPCRQATGADAGVTLSGKPYEHAELIHCENAGVYERCSGQAPLRTVLSCAQ